MPSYTKEESELLCNYIGEVRPSEAGRMGNAIYQSLVQNVDKWPWAETHTWSGWREHYIVHKEEFDHRIRKMQKEKRTRLVERDASPSRNIFTDNEDKLLVRYLSTYNPQSKGWDKNAIYIRLVENKDGKWNWSEAHPWQFWRQRYLSRKDYFDLEIARHIELHNVPIPPSSRTMPPDHDTGRPAKRQKTMDNLDSQEEKLIHLVASTPEKNTRVKEEPIEPTEILASTSQINETRSAHLPETVEVVDDDNIISANKDDNEDEADISFVSEDYAGEIFEDIVKNRGENGAGSRSGSDTGDEGKIQPIIEKDGVPQSFSKSLPSRPLSKPHIHHNHFLVAPELRDGDPFLDSPPPVAKKEHTSFPTRNCPLILKEGPFGTHLGRRRPKKADKNSNDVVTHNAQPAWPPRRRKTEVLSQILLENEVEEERHRRHDAEERRRVKGKAKAVAEGIDTEVGHQENSTQTPKSILADEALESIKSRTSHHLRYIATEPSRLTPLRRRRTDTFHPSSRLASISTTKRHSIGGAIHLTNVSNDTSLLPASRSSTRTLDLRQNMIKRDLNLPTQRPSPRVSNASYISNMSEEDSSLLQGLAIQKFSQEFGFTESVVQDLWNNLKSLQLLKSALTDMKESAERSMNEWLEGVEDAAEIEVQDEDDEMFDVQSQQDATEEAQSGIPSGILTDLSSPIERQSSNHDGKMQDTYGAERETYSRHHLLQGHKHDHRHFLENDQERKSEHKGKVEISAPKRSDAERWKEVEHLFLAANHQTVEDLRKIEKDFDPLLIMRWIASRATMV